MITLIEQPFQPNSQCVVVACRFNPAVIGEKGLAAIEAEWQTPVPERLQNAVQKRKAEYIAGRYCAKQAFEQLTKKNNSISINDFHIGTAENRAPIWPNSVCGSITHSKGYAAAAVGLTDVIRSVGIDSEKIVEQKTANNIASHILTKDEQLRADKGEYKNDDIADFVTYLTLLFSAKESIYKCLFPLVNQFFNFHDAVILIDSNTPGVFRFELNKMLNSEFKTGYQGKGHYKLDDGFVHTAIVLSD